MCTVFHLFLIDRSSFFSDAFLARSVRQCAASMASLQHEATLATSLVPFGGGAREGEWGRGVRVCVSIVVFERGCDGCGGLLANTRVVGAIHQVASMAGLAPTYPDRPISDSSAPLGAVPLFRGCFGLAGFLLRALARLQVPAVGVGEQALLNVRRVVTQCGERGHRFTR